MFDAPAPYNLLSKSVSAAIEDDDKNESPSNIVIVLTRAVDEEIVTAGRNEENENVTLHALKMIELAMLS